MTSRRITLGRKPSPVHLDLDVLLRTRLLIQGGSGAGKSYLIRYIAEQLFGQLPIIIIDPEGEFATLRERHDFVLVGPNGETPADVRSAALVAQTLLRLNASAVCDIYEMDADQRHEWVKAFLDALVDAPKDLWQTALIIVDEAHMFVPERGAGESVATNAMIALTTRGRKRGYVPVFATQRLSKLRKDVAAELHNVLIGKTFIDLDRKRVMDTLGIEREAQAEFGHDLKKLNPGEFWAFGPALTLDRLKVKIGKVRTTHADQGTPGTRAVPPPPANVRALMSELADLPQQAIEKAENLEDLQRLVSQRDAEIVKLKADLTSKKTDVDAAAVLHAIRLARSRLDSQLSALRDDFEEQHRGALQSYDAISRLVDPNGTPLLVPPHSEAAPLTAGASATPTAPQSSATASAEHATNGDGGAGGRLPLGEGYVLVALAGTTHHPPDMDQIDVLTGYSRSTRDKYIQRLMRRGLVTRERGYPEVTSAGRMALAEGRVHHGASLIIGSDLVKRYKEACSAEGERVIFGYLVEQWPQTVKRDDLPGNYSRSTRDKYIQRLERRKIISSDRGEVFASPHLFRL